MHKQLFETRFILGYVFSLSELLKNIIMDIYFK